MPLAMHDLDRLASGAHHDPFAVLGCHREANGEWSVRALVRDALSVRVQVKDGDIFPLTQRGEGVFEGSVGVASDRPNYLLLVTRSWHADEERLERDPYSFWLQISEWDLDRYRAGQHHDLERMLGARPAKVDGCSGTIFAVWAPAAERVSVIGDWNGFDGRWHPMRLRHPFGVWELFIPGVGPGAHYKYEIRGRDGALRTKADPIARMAEQPPATASVVNAPSQHEWTDDNWMVDRGAWRSRPMAIYEVHLGSWRGGPDTGYQNYRDAAPQLVAHCKKFGFTHVEFLPLAQHPYGGSWGYQVSGQFAPDRRHGDPDDFRYLVNELHNAGIGVIVDYVPAHFPKDDFALAQFDGHPCYEYADPKEGEHKDWDTLIFNYRRPEVRNYLIGAALYWIREFHVDGLRVDAVSSMLYRNYSREDGEWVPNEYGGDANLEAVDFLQELTDTVHQVHPGTIMIAEESTSWENVTRPTATGGLGFDLKWNMGWMHDSLAYLSQDPVMRSGNHDRITFHQWYAYDEQWVLPLSHDEVVHGKHSLLDKLPGDYHQRLAEYRQLLAWQIAVPGRPLLFMGGEFAQGREWDWQAPLQWQEADEPEREGVQSLLASLLSLYREHAALWQADDQRSGFRWVDEKNREESVIAFLRQAPGERSVLAVFNFTPVARDSYPLGVPDAGAWEVIANSDDLKFGGSGVGSQMGSALALTDERRDGWAGVIRCDLPASGALLLLAPESV